MDKRVVLAMTLIFLTTMVWMLTMSPQPPEPGTQPDLVEQTDHDMTSRDSTISSANDSMAATEKPRIVVSDDDGGLAETVEPELADQDSSALIEDFNFSGPGERVIVETDLFRAVLNTRGAVLESWELKEFRGYVDGELIDPLPLIPPAPRSQNMAFRLPIGDNELDFSNVVFATEFGNVNLSGKGEQEQRLIFTATRGEQLVEVHYIFDNNSYSFGYDIKTEQIELTDKPIYFQWNTGLTFTEKDTKTEAQFVTGMLDQEGEIENYDRGKITKKNELVGNDVYRWIGIKNHYFTFIASPLNTELGFFRFTADEVEEARISAEWSIPTRTLNYQENDFEVYIGPQNYDLLKAYHRNWEGVVDFGWDWIEPLSRFMLTLFTFFHQFIPSYGWVIVFFAALTKIIFYPLMQKQLKSMKAMADLQPEMERLKKKHKDDPQKVNQEMIKLYQKHKVNPLSGCFPILIQMPIFISLYNVLRTTIYLRDAPFLWLTDLSQNPELSVVGAILPLLMGGSMFLTQKMSSSASGAMSQQQKMMLYLLPTIFTVFSFQWSSGLILYWFVNNILTIIQQFFINKSKKEEVKE